MSIGPARSVLLLMPVSVPLLALIQLRGTLSVHVYPKSSGPPLPCGVDAAATSGLLLAGMNQWPSGAFCGTAFCGTAPGGTASGGTASGGNGVVLMEGGCSAGSSDAGSCAAAGRANEKINRATRINCAMGCVFIE